MVYYDVIIFILGLAFLIGAWLPSKFRKVPFTIPIIWLAVGFFIALVDPVFPDVNPLKNSVLTEHVTELVIIVSLLSAGLKLDRPMSVRTWADTWRLLGLTMPLSIGLMMFLSMYLLSLPLPVALLLGALIVPTDPVLASDVQVGPPNQGNEHDVRFALTSEAGLNDGLAFPFVSLALILVSHPGSYYLLPWFLWHVVGKILLAIGAGWCVGYFTAWLILRPTAQMVIRDGFIAIALIFLAYGGTQLVHGYGFLGVFIAAHVFRHYESAHKFHTTLYRFAEQVERLIIPLLLILMALFMAQGIFAQLLWQEVLLMGAFLFVIRPVSGMIGLIGTQTTLYHKSIISIFGIRGISSFYYLAYALNQTNYFNPYGAQLWRVSLLIVLVSIIFHGVSASIVFQRLTDPVKKK